MPKSTGHCHTALQPEHNTATHLLLPVGSVLKIEISKLCVAVAFAPVETGSGIPFWTAGECGQVTARALWSASPGKDEPKDEERVEWACLVQSQKQNLQKGTGNAPV